MNAPASDTLTLIPARLEASRLPGKPLKDIAGEPMIVHVWRRAMEAEIGPVIVAADHPDIAAAVAKAGGTACLTRPDHQSGSDRIFEALNSLENSEKYNNIINLQGDLPTLEPALIHACAALLAEPEVDISTLATPITDPTEATNPNVVKMVGSPLGPGRHHALYFTRATAPYGEGPLYHHIGIYGYKRASLARFISLPPSPLEQREKLEQLRALEAGLRIDVAIVDTHPLGVDTPDDLEKARAALGGA